MMSVCSDSVIWIDMSIIVQTFAVSSHLYGVRLGSVRIGKGRLGIGSVRLGLD